MTEFKVGDRVLDVDSHHAGQVGVVIAIDGKRLHQVKFKDGTSTWYTADELERGPDHDDCETCGTAADPTIYRLQVPSEPPEHVTRVRPVGYAADVVYERRSGLWAWDGLGPGTWQWLLSKYPGGVEPVPDEPEESAYDVARRWFRGRTGSVDDLDLGDAGPETQQRAAVIVRTVLADEPAAPVDQRRLRAAWDGLESAMKDLETEGFMTVRKMIRRRVVEAQAAIDGVLAGAPVLADEPTSAGPDIGAVLRELASDLTKIRAIAAGAQASGISVALNVIRTLIARHTGEVRDA